MKLEEDNVGFFELRVRRRFILWLLAFFVGLPLLLSILQPGRDSRMVAKRVATLAEMKSIAKAFREGQLGFTALPLSTNGGLQITLLGGGMRKALSNCLDRTNVQGELLDIWKTPLRFEPLGTTNLIIRSAGSNHQFGDKNDLVFNCVSNSLVKP